METAFWLKSIGLKLSSVKVNSILWNFLSLNKCPSLSPIRIIICCPYKKLLEKIYIIFDLFSFKKDPIILSQLMNIFWDPKISTILSDRFILSEIILLANPNIFLKHFSLSK